MPVEALRQAVDTATMFCSDHGVAVATIEELPASDLKRLALIEDAVNALISPDPLRREFLGNERLVSTLYNAVKPNPAGFEYASRVACLAAIAATIHAKLHPDPVSICEVMGDIGPFRDRDLRRRDGKYSNRSATD